MVIFAGDLNADLGMKGGPCATTVVKGVSPAELFVDH